MAKVTESPMGFIPSLADNDESLNRMLDEQGIGRRVAVLYLLVVVCAFLYGVLMGSYRSPVQALLSGLKLVVLFSGTLLICLPAFLVVQYVMGSRLRLFQILSVVLSGIVLSLLIMVSFAPIVVIFLLTGSNYFFLRLLHVAVFGVAGIFGMMRVVSVLKFACERKGVYPHTGVVVFRFWAVIMAFVGIQMAWNLRPFMGDPGASFQMFRQYESNFYTALIHSTKQLLRHEDPPAGTQATPGPEPADSTLDPSTLFDK